MKITLTIDGRDLQNLLACLADAGQNGVKGSIEYRVEEGPDRILIVEPIGDGMYRVNEKSDKSLDYPRGTLLSSSRVDTLLRNHNTKGWKIQVLMPSGGMVSPPGSDSAVWCFDHTTPVIK
jgi:hypothetical protein